MYIVIDEHIQINLITTKCIKCVVLFYIKDLLTKEKSI